VYRCPGGGSDNTQGSDVLGEWLFVDWIEQALCLQFGFAGFKRRLQCPSPGRLDMLRDQLELAATLVQGHPGANPDRITIGDLDFEALVVPTEHGASHLGLIVLKRKIPVAGCWSGQVTDLSVDPDVVEVGLQQGAHLAVQLTDGIGFSRVHLFTGEDISIYNCTFILTLPNKWRRHVANRRGGPDI